MDSDNGSRSFVLPRTREVIEGPAALVAAAAVGRAGRLVVLTSASVAATSSFAAIVEGLGAHHCQVLAGVRPHNHAAVVGELIASARRHAPEAIVAVGGGSVHDAAKLVALGVALGQDDPDVLRARTMGAVAPASLSGNVPPIVAVPVTLSAAEWNGYAGYVTTTSEKSLVGHLELTPHTVVLDPTLVAQTPRDLWAQTGVRTLDHAIEQLTSTASHPWSDALAVEAVGQITRHLPASVADATDHVAALGCLRAAWLSSSSVHNVKMGLSHAIGHQLGAAGMPHGATSCVVLPHVLRHLADRTAAAQERIRTAMAAAGHGGSSAAEAVDRWLDGLGVPRRLRDFDLRPEDLDRVAQATLRSPLMAYVPGPLTTADVRTILDQAW